MVPSDVDCNALRLLQRSSAPRCNAFAATSERVRGAALRPAAAVDLCGARHAAARRHRKAARLAPPPCRSGPRHVATRCRVLQRNTPRCNAVPRVARRCHVLHGGATCCNVATQHATLRHGTMRHVPRRCGPVPCRGAMACAVATAPSVSLHRLRFNAAVTPLQRVRSVARVRCRPRSCQLLDEPAALGSAAAAPPPFERATRTQRRCCASCCRRAAPRCVVMRLAASQRAASQHASPRCNTPCRVAARMCARRAPSRIQQCCSVVDYVATRNVAPRCTTLHRVVQCCTAKR
jgi:hypothetical protein